MYKNNSRYSSKFMDCSSLQLYCKLKDLSSAVGYYSYTNRYQHKMRIIEINGNKFSNLKGFY